MINDNTNPEIRISQVCICFMSAAPIPMDPTDALITHITLSRAPAMHEASRQLIAGPCSERAGQA